MSKIMICPKSAECDHKGKLNLTSANVHCYKHEEEDDCEYPYEQQHNNDIVDCPACIPYVDHFCVFRNDFFVGKCVEHPNFDLCAGVGMELPCQYWKPIDSTYNVNLNRTL